MASVPSAHDPPIHLTYFFSLKILNQIFLHRVSNIFAWRTAVFIVSNKDTWKKKGGKKRKKKITKKDLT